jgi:hypothetical protein
VGGPGNNTVVGSSDASAAWQLAGPNAGTLAGPAYGSTVSFGNVRNLAAGAGGDTFQFAAGATLAGNLYGGTGSTLDYTAYTTSVVVDLQPDVTSATGVGGVVGGISAAIGAGGAAGTPGLYNLLIGLGGEYLQGGTGRRNLLVAGGTPGTPSTLVGGDGEDLLIAGGTAYDDLPGLDSWLAIADYWAGAGDFGARAAGLLAGAGVPKLDATRVTGNGPGNALTGNGGSALLYSDGMDTPSGFGFVQPVLISP